jgi:hypothetical protein
MAPPRPEALVALNPVALAPPSIASGGPRMEPPFVGRRVALLSNNKPNADVLLAEVGRALVDRLGVEVARYDKDIPSLEAPADLRAAIERDCAGVVLAVYD